MARSSCTSCGLRSQHCQCRQEASTAGNANVDNRERAFKLTPVSFCVVYLVTTFAAMGIIFLSVFGIMSAYRYRVCHLEVFVDSFSVSNANTTAIADWNVGFAAKSPDNGCKASLHTIKSRLLRGDKLIAESKTPDYFGKVVNGKIYEPLSYAVFKTVKTPESIAGGVIWDLRLEVVFSVLINRRSYNELKQGFFIVTCGDIPVNLTAEPAGSLLGSMRPCEYLFREELQEYKDTYF